MSSQDSGPRRSERLKLLKRSAPDLDPSPTPDARSGREHRAKRTKVATTGGGRDAASGGDPGHVASGDAMDIDPTPFATAHAKPRANAKPRSRRAAPAPNPNPSYEVVGTAASSSAGEQAPPASAGDSAADGNKEQEEDGGDVWPSLVVKLRVGRALRSHPAARRTLLVVLRSPRLRELQWFGQGDESSIVVTTGADIAPISPPSLPPAGREDTHRPGTPRHSDTSPLPLPVRSPPPPPVGPATSPTALPPAIPTISVTPTVAPPTATPTATTTVHNRVADKQPRNRSNLTALLAVPSSPSDSDLTADEENESRFFECQGSSHRYIYQVARYCEHAIHTVHEDYAHEMCPSCRVQRAITEYQDAQARLAARGGVMKSALKNDGNSHSNILGDREAIEQREANGGVGRPFWRTSKKTLVNLEIELQKMAEMEDQWDLENMLDIDTQAAFPWEATSANRALTQYQLRKESLRYAPGDPADTGFTAVSPKRTYEPNDEDEEDDPDFWGERPKRRCITFHDTVIVSEDHDIDTKPVGDGSFVQRLKRYRKLYPPRTTTVSLKNDKKRGSQRWQRARKAYTPGAWASPAGYEKANTSWCLVTAEKMTRDLRMEDILMTLVNVANAPPDNDDVENGMEEPDDGNDESLIRIHETFVKTSYTIEALRVRSIQEQISNYLEETMGIEKI